MPEYLETTVDKFTFKVATDRLYTPEGVWVKPDGETVRVGLSDFPQQRSGDVAFAEIKPAGEQVEAGDEFASIETIKVTISLGSPVAGQILDTNPELEATPELINQDPYGEGWIAILKASDWASDKVSLLEPEAYFEVMKQQAQAASK